MGSDAVVEAVLCSLAAMLLALCERVARWLLAAVAVALAAALADWELR